MSVLKTYLDFLMDYAPYFYYLPDAGTVDSEWGKGALRKMKMKSEKFRRINRIRGNEDRNRTLLECVETLEKHVEEKANPA